MSGACEWFELVQYVESFDMGINFLEGPPGPPGPAGEAIFIPSVSEDGVLSWTNTAGLPNPDPIDLAGPAGTTDYDDLEHKPSINGVELSGNKTTADLQIWTDSVLQAAVKAVTANGSSSNTLSGLTAKYVVGNWGLFSDAACTTPIPVNQPTCDITITTSENVWTLTIANFSSAFYIRPTFILRQN